MSPPIKTVGPLHFEDLEPHRFEDLIRQLVYRWKSWESLEATGVVGNDGGVDIRGIERAPSTDSSAERPLFDRREWRFQCKRVKTLHPSEMRTLVADLFQGGGRPPYGIVVAAACDVSGEALKVMHEGASTGGAACAEAWTGRHVEDLLRRPTNRDLLFTYFGISFDPAESEAVDCITAISNELQHNLAVLSAWTHFAGAPFERSHYRKALGLQAFSVIPRSVRNLVAVAYTAMGTVEENIGRRPRFQMGFPDARHHAFEMDLRPVIERATIMTQIAQQMIETYLEPEPSP